MPKGERAWAQSKRTTPPPNFKTKDFQLVNFKNDISKPSWTLRGGFHWGGVLCSQRKSIWNRGRKFQILKMLRKILFIYLWLFAKGLWKGFTKDFAKTKHVVQTWSKMLKFGRIPEAKAVFWANTDTEQRKRGEQTGLDTLVVNAINDVN